VGGLPKTTIDDIKNLAAACNCEVDITGGTEYGHASHAANVPIFDLSKTVKLYDFIKNNATVKENPSFCNPNSTGVCYKKWLYNGYWFTDETTGDVHWHVCKDGTTAPAGYSVGLFTKACTKI
jgi:hypothetical protein